MIVCEDQRSGYGCGAENSDGTQYCLRCGMTLQYAIHLQDPGSLVKHYQIMRVIGYGTFGAVYEAVDTRNPTLRVALKETFEASKVLSFQHEFLVLSDLSHPNLPCYYEMFEVNDCGYLVMEFVPGQSLDEMLARQKGPLPEQLLIAYAEQLCDLLSYLHSLHPPVIHRDIKPSNVRVTPEGTVKLVDFGLFKHGIQTTRQTLHGLGTLEYMPLEQFDWSGGTDQRSDIYSLGATFYHLLTGQYPISAPKRMSRARDPLRPPHKLNSRVSRHVSDAIMHAISRFPQDRYPNAEAFKRDLLGKNQRVISGASAEKTLQGHSSFVYSVAWSPDGRILASAGEDKTICLWSPEDGSLLKVLEGHTSKVSSVAWSPDGQTLASAGGDRTVRLWSVAHGSLLKMLVGHKGNVTCVAWSPDGDSLASCSVDTTVCLWSVADGALVHELRGSEPAKVYSVAWRPDGQVLAAGYEDHTVRLWHVGEPITLHSLPGHTSYVYGLAWSPDGQSLASASADATVRVWRLAKGHLVDEIQRHKSWAAQLAWSPSSKIAGYGGQPRSDSEKLWLWRVSDGSLCTILHGHHNYIYSVTWNPDGQALASASADSTIWLWRNDGSVIRALTGHTDWVYSVAWSPDGHLLASASLDGTVRIWAIEYVT